VGIFLVYQKEKGKGKLVYVYKQGWKSIHKSTRHVNANVNTQKGNEDHQNNSSSNEVEDIKLKGHPMPQVS